MKRLVLALAAIGLTASLSAYAAIPTGAQATDINVPVDQAGFFLGGSALYLQPSISGNDLNYTNPYTNVTLPSAPDYKINNIDPSYNWGFDVFGGYNFGNGNDLSLKYTRLKTSDSETTTVPIGLGNFVKDTKGDADIKLDQFDLLAGQQINIGCAHKLHLFGGLRYAKLDRDLNINQTVHGDIEGNAQSTPIASVDDESDFKGIGPIVGADGTYYLGYGVGLVAGVDTGLLIGKANDTYTNIYANNPTNTGVGAPVDYSTLKVETDSHRRVVPVADAKLGMDYTLPFQNYGSLTAEAGWKISQYWNAVDSINVSPNENRTVTSTSTNSVGYQGPYVTLTYRGIPTL